MRKEAILMRGAGPDRCGPFWIPRRKVNHRDPLMQAPK